MALTNTSVPSVMPTRVATYDAATAFAKAQTLTATGYANNVQTQVNVFPGRFEGYLILDLSSMKVSAGNETYQFFLMGSNDANWANGNQDLLVARDFAAATAGRLVPTILAASPSVPLAPGAATRHEIPFCNKMGGFMFQYLQLYVVIGGTAPTVTFTAYITYDAC